MNLDFVETEAPSLLDRIWLAGDEDEDASAFDWVAALDDIDPDYDATEDAKRIAKESRKRARREVCGRKGHREDATTGGVHKFNFWCGDFHECPICLERRATLTKNSVKSRVWRAWDQGGVNVIHGPADVVAAALKGMDKETFLRVPAGDGETWAFLSADAGIGETLDETAIMGLDWHNLALTPAHQRMSGSLGKASDAPKEKPEPDFTVQVRSFITKELTARDQEMAIEMGTLDTIDLKPTTEEELKDALLTRRAAIVKRLQELGARVVVMPRYYQAVQITRIGWGDIRTKLTVTPELFGRRKEELASERDKDASKA